ncbi:MAG TPA: asparagine synthase (glutamine-hydrolyzing) [Thermoanaerobaculia bacterium]|nr:asparagine synthase (glutamine-hydrolyzing) [Thermoanaerobaculia bacterium]
MCGIVGFAGREPIAPESLARMRDTMTHRGPDDLGLWYSADGTVGLAQRRLSIIDLSPGGHQPMADAAQRVHVSFNGEIYNFKDVRRELESRGHVFHTSSDTEVILAAYREWSDDFLRHLAGMFALSLYDDAKRVLYLARDRAGEKPLFVWRTPTRIVFASELKALFTIAEFPRRLNVQALEHYLAFGYVPRDLCIVNGVTKLLPGSMLRYEVDSGNARLSRYWELPEFDERNASRTADDLADELHELLREAVSRQMIADVPIGVLLSGGIDSSLVTAMAAAAAPKVRTFTITFPGHRSYDEAPFARMVAQHFGTEHIELPAEEATIGLLPALVRQYDEPLGDSSAIPTYLVSRLIRKHATVALGGDGGDELFGGYPQYVWVHRIDAVHRLVPAPLRRLFGGAARMLPVGTRGRNYFVAIGMNGTQALTRTSLFFDEDWRARMLATHSSSGTTPEELRMELASGGHTLLQSMQRIDFRSYMVDDILVKVDRASMLASLETRAPLLDPSIIEFAFRCVPDHIKVNLRERKILLRHLAGRLLPKQLDLRRKQGFSIPLDAWLAGEWGLTMRGVLAEADRDIFNRDAIARLFDGNMGNYSHRIYALTVFELWRREYNITL